MDYFLYFNMKSLTILLLFNLSFLCFNAQITIEQKDLSINPKNGSKVRLDSTFVNFIIIDKSDTVFFNSPEAVFTCNYLQKLDRKHNNCCIIVDGKLVSGSVILHIENKENIIEYRGTVINGHYETGYFKKYYLDNTIALIGKYENNWKVGVWKTFSKTGKIESKQFFKKYDDEPKWTK